MGKNIVIELQGVLRPAPKPSLLRRGLAYTASRIALAMIGTVLLTSQAMAGGFWVQMTDGWIYIPDELLIAFIFVVVAAVALTAMSSSSVARMSRDLPEEVREPQSVEYYEHMTARTRALKRKLDADTELAESYIKAARTRAERDDLDDEAYRRAVSR